MEWYKIVIMIPVVILGIYTRGRIYDYKNNYHRSEDWKHKKTRGFKNTYTKILHSISCKKIIYTFDLIYILITNKLTSICEFRLDLGSCISELAVIF